MADHRRDHRRDPDLLQTLIGAVLVANCEGAHRAIRAGVPNLAFVVSASESHNKSNVGRTIAQSLEQLQTIIDELQRSDQPPRVNIATAFDCPFTGTVPTTSVRSLADAIATYCSALRTPRCAIRQVEPFRPTSQAFSAMQEEH